MNIKKDFGNTKNRVTDISATVYGKIPPQATEVEEAVLGAILLERDAFDVSMGLLKNENAFYHPANQSIYRQMLELANKGYPVDMMTVTESLRKSNELELIGGAHYITSLVMNVVSGAHVETHCRIILEKYMLRESIRIAGQIIGSGYDDTTDAFDLINYAQNELEEVTAGLSTADVKTISQVTLDAVREIEGERFSIVEPGAHVGLEGLREIIKYWRETDTVVIAARPGTGKTATALNIAEAAATYAPKPTPVAILSMEMKDVQLVKRLHSNVMGIPLWKLLEPKKMTNEEFDYYRSVHKRFESVPIYIDQEPSLNINQICAKARKYKRKYGIGILIIDYLQLIDFGKETVRDGLTRVTRRLKQLAKELEITIIELSQLNREVEKRSGAKPVLSDLKESGSIEEDADVIIFLSRPTEAEIKEDLTLEDKVVFSVAKFRNGKTDDFYATFNREYQRFESNTLIDNPNSLYRRPNNDNAPF